MTTPKRSPGSRRPGIWATPIAFAALLTASSAPAQECDLERAGGLTLNGGGSSTSAPILETHVEINVTGMIARTRVTQTFYNPTTNWMEGVYVFPLPEGAAVDHLLMYVGDRVIEGRIEERTQAKRTYETARDQGFKASLVEQDRANIFRTHLANIGPDETVEIDIELQHLARYDNGELRLRFPTVVAPRFTRPTDTSPDHQEPNATTELMNAIARALHPINPLQIEITVDSGIPLRALYSPTHQIDTDQIGDSTYVASLSGDAFADRDFVLAWRPDVGDTPASAVFYEELDGDVYALVMALPPADFTQPRGSATREVVFVIDSSGSMGGASIRQAKLALLLALDELRPGDYFDVVEFNSEARSLFGRSVAASFDTIDEARKFVDGLSANGGTNIMAALALALVPASAPTDIRQVVFVTDGAVGNEAQIFTYVADRLGDSRLFTVGIGSAPNSHFMRKAAHFGRGTYTYIGSPEEVSERMGVLFEKLDSTALTDIEVIWNDPAGAETFPSSIPDLYRGEPLIVAARLASAPNRIEVHGVHEDGQPWSSTEELPRESATVDRGIGRLWARQKIESLMDDLALGANRAEVRQEVIDIAIDHNLVTKFTSLVAVDITPSAPPGASQSTLLPLNRPAGALPRTATPAALHALIAAILIVSGLALRNAPTSTTRRRNRNESRLHRDFRGGENT